MLSCPAMREDLLDKAYSLGRARDLLQRLKSYISPSYSSPWKAAREEPSETLAEEGQVPRLGHHGEGN